MCERSEKCAGEKWNADTGTTLWSHVANSWYRVARDDAQLRIETDHNREKRIADCPYHKDTSEPKTSTEAARSKMMKEGLEKGAKVNVPGGKYSSRTGYVV